MRELTSQTLESPVLGTPAGWVLSGAIIARETLLVFTSYDERDLWGSEYVETGMLCLA